MKDDKIFGCPVVSTWRTLVGSLSLECKVNLYAKDRSLLVYITLERVRVYADWVVIPEIVRPHDRQWVYTEKYDLRSPKDRQLIRREVESKVMDGTCNLWGELTGSHAGGWRLSEKWGIPVDTDQERS